MTRASNILTVMMGGIGNLILFVPALRSLRQGYPEARLTLMTAQPGVEEILSGEGLVDDVLCLEAGPWSFGPSLWRWIRSARRRRFQLSLTAGTTNAFKASLMTWLMGARERVGEDIQGKGLFYTRKVAFKPGTHETVGALRCVEALGLPVVERQASLRCSSGEQAFARGMLRDLGAEGRIVVGMHVGSGERQAFKRWPLDRFVRVGRRLMREYGVVVVLTGSSKEQTLVREAAGAMGKGAIPIAGRCSLRQTAAVIQQCDLFVSNDSGPAHIAAAVGTPLIVLFGPTPRQRVEPLGDHVRVIDKGTKMTDISLDDVWRVALDHARAAGWTRKP